MNNEGKPAGLGSCEGLGPTPLPAPDLQTDPCSSDGTQTDYYTAGTVLRLLAAERERCAKVAEAEDVAPTDDAVGVQQCIAASIRRA